MKGDATPAALRELAGQHGLQGLFDTMALARGGDVYDAREQLQGCADAWENDIQAHKETRREVERLRIGLMNAAHEAGQDPGGMTHPDHLVHPDIVEYALAAVRELRELYSEALEET